MMKLIDVREEVEKDVEFGTCELCFSVGDLEKTVYILQDDEGNIHEVEGGEWSWGDYYNNIDTIENLIDFAGFVSQQEPPEEGEKIELWFINCANNYIQNYQDN